MNLTKSLTLLVSILALIQSPHAAAYTSWASATPMQWGENHLIPYVALYVDFSIIDEPYPGMNDVMPACATRQCDFGIKTFKTGEAPWGKPNGNAAASQFARDSDSLAVKMAQGSTWAEGYAQWIRKNGTSGRAANYFWMQGNDAKVYWPVVCAGFGAVPKPEKGHQFFADLAPGSTCGGIQQPDLVCTVDVPMLLDLGTVGAGTDSASGQVVGSFACSEKSTVAATLMNRPQIDSHAVEIEVNNVRLGNAPVVVGDGTNVPLIIKATIRGTLRTAGNYSTDAVLKITYY